MPPVSSPLAAGAAAGADSEPTTSVAGRYEVDLPKSSLFIYTYKAGLLSAMGHDLRLLAPTYECVVEPGADGKQTLIVTVDVKSIIVDGQSEVSNGVPKVSPLGDWTNKEILKNMLSDQILDADVHPKVVYQGVINPRSGSESIIDGQLQLHGETRPLRLESQVASDESGAGLRIEGEIVINPSQWGIKPFSAMFGAMKLKDEVRITWSTHCVKA